MNEAERDKALAGRRKAYMEGDFDPGWFERGSCRCTASSRWCRRSDPLPLAVSVTAKEVGGDVAARGGLQTIRMLLANSAALVVNVV
jgi:hypothetical protein